jgi:hypothetical protein
MSEDHMVEEPLARLLVDDADPPRTARTLQTTRGTRM